MRVVWRGGAAAGAAAAHLVNTDLGPFYGGLVPPLTAPRAGRGCLVLLSATGVAGTSSPEPSTLLILGLLVAVNWHLPTGMTEGLSLIFGVTHGPANGAAAVAAGVSRDLFVTGLLTAGVVLATLVPALVLSLRAAWSQVAVRVVGN